MAEYLPLDFDFTVTGVTTSGKTVTEEGQAMSNLELESFDDYVDDGMYFAAAVDSALFHFYTMRIEKGGHELAEVTVTVKNLRYE